MDSVGMHKKYITRETNSPSKSYQKNIRPRYRRTGASPRSILFFLPFYISILTNGGRRGEMGQRCVSVCGFCMCSVYVHTYGEVVNGLANCTQQKEEEGNRESVIALPTTAKKERAEGPPFPLFFYPMLVRP